MPWAKLWEWERGDHHWYSRDNIFTYIIYVGNIYIYIYIYTHVYNDNGCSGGIMWIYIYSCIAIYYIYIYIYTGLYDGIIFKKVGCLYLVEEPPPEKYARQLGLSYQVVLNNPKR